MSKPVLAVLVGTLLALVAWLLASGDHTPELSSGVAAPTSAPPTTAAVEPPAIGAAEDTRPGPEVSPLADLHRHPAGVVDAEPQRPPAPPASARSEPHAPVPRGTLASYLELVLTVEKAEVTRDEPIVFRLTLRNIGDLPVEAIRPRRAYPIAGHAVYDLTRWMNSRPTSHFVGAASGAATGALQRSDVIHLSPGAAVECKIDQQHERWATWAKTYKDPGRYKFRMVYVFQRASGERPSVEGDPERTVEASDWDALQRVDEGEVFSNEVVVVRKQ